jgi:hypothetical protein
MVPSSMAPIEVGDIVEVLDLKKNWIMEKTTDLKNSIWICSDNNGYSLSSVRHPMVLDLSLLKKEMDDNRGEELAIFPSYQVFTNIVKRNVMKWEDSMAVLEGFYDVEIQGLCRRATAFLNFPKSLSRLLLVTSLKIIAELRKNSSEMLQQELEKETRPFTMNHYLYDNLIKLVIHNINF